MEKNTKSEFDQVRDNLRRARNLALTLPFALAAASCAHLSSKYATEKSKDAAFAYNLCRNGEPNIDPSALPALKVVEYYAKRGVLCALVAPGMWLQNK